MPGPNTPDWRPTGLVWDGSGVALGWLSPTGEPRISPLHLGSRLALRVGADRRCLGLRWDGRWFACAAHGTIDAAATGGQCAACQALARSRSIATDTALDDPRQFSVYLAHHGSVIKAGITASERGPNRLLEQGALSSVFLSTGTLLSARRCESLLTTALGLPQQVRTPRKRRARTRPAAASSRAGDLSAVVARAGELDWPDGQTYAPTPPADHTCAYGLPADGITPTRQLDPLRPDATVTGELVCRIGRDLYLDTPAGILLVDSGLLQGWSVRRADDDAPFTATSSALPESRPAPEHRPDVLF